jgi:hypothetical protein
MRLKAQRTWTEWPLCGQRGVPVPTCGIKKREEQVLDPLQVSEEESSSSEFPELEEGTSSESEQEDTQGVATDRRVQWYGSAMSSRAKWWISDWRMECQWYAAVELPTSAQHRALSGRVPGLATSGSSCGDWKGEGEGVPGQRPLLRAICAGLF